jgi:hypothetical protein
MQQQRLVLALVVAEVGGVDPGFGNIGIGGRPDQGLPGYGHPDQGLPGQGGHPGNRPPGSSGGHPDNSLPWSPGHPDNSLPLPPGISPPTAPPNLKDKLVVMWRLPNTTEWHGKAVDPGANPDQGLPGGRPPHASGQPVPGGQPDQGLPPTATPKS